MPVSARISTAFLAVAIFGSQVCPTAVAAGLADEQPYLNEVQGEADGPVVPVGDGWAVQRWKWKEPDEEGNTLFCIAGKRQGTVSLNLVLGSGDYAAMTIWEPGTGMTDALAPEEMDVTLEMDFNDRGTLSAEAAWEYGVISVDLNDEEIVKAIADGGSVTFSLRSKPERTVEFDLAGSMTAMTELVKCQLDLSGPLGTFPW